MNFDKLFDHRSDIGKPTEQNNKLLAEAILRDATTPETFNAIYESVGVYGNRDGIINTTPNICEGEGETASKAEKYAVLVVAKEANSHDYEMYVKAIATANAYYKKLVAEFGDIAKSRIESVKDSIRNNDRVNTELLANHVDM